MRGFLQRTLRAPAAKLVLFGLCIAPALWLGVMIWQAAGGSPVLGADPAEAIMHWCGEWAFWLLLATLSVSPLRQITAIAEFARYRRMLGLFAFFYAVLHLVAYIGLYLELQLGAVAADIVKRPYITVGFAAFLLLVPLAVTSTNGLRRALGPHWKTLHRVIYASVLLALLHVVWLTRADYADAALFGFGVLVMLGYRAFQAASVHRRQRSEKSVKKQLLRG